MRLPLDMMDGTIRSSTFWFTRKKSCRAATSTATGRRNFTVGRIANRFYNHSVVVCFDPPVA